MTPDHRPYLRPGVDLMTAEDAAQWLDEQAREIRRGHAMWAPSSAPDRVRASERALVEADALLYAARDLEARLDRERRQACRRGALDHWRRHCIAVRLLAKAANARERFEYETCGTRLRAAALAFRAAARGGR